MVGVDVAGVGEAGGEAMANGDGGAVCPWSVLGTVWKKFWREEVEFGGKKWNLAGRKQCGDIIIWQDHSIWYR